MPEDIVFTISGDNAKLKAALNESKQLLQQASQQTQAIALKPTIDVASIKQQLQAAFATPLVIKPQIDATSLRQQIQSAFQSSGISSNLGIGTGSSGFGISSYAAALSGQAGGPPAVTQVGSSVLQNLGIPLARAAAPVQQAASQLNQAAARLNQLVSKGEVGGQGQSSGSGAGGSGAGGLSPYANPFSERGLARLLGSAALVYGGEEAIRASAGFVQAQQIANHPERIQQQYEEQGASVGIDVMHDKGFAAQARYEAAIEAETKSLESAEALPLIGSLVSLIDAAADWTGSLKDAEKATKDTVAVRLEGLRNTQNSNIYAAENSGVPGAGLRKKLDVQESAELKKIINASRESIAARTGRNPADISDNEAFLNADSAARNGYADLQEDNKKRVALETAKVNAQRTAQRQSIGPLFSQEQAANAQTAQDPVSELAAKQQAESQELHIKQQQEMAGLVAAFHDNPTDANKKLSDDAQKRFLQQDNTLKAQQAAAFADLDRTSNTRQRGYDARTESAQDLQLGRKFEASETERNARDRAERDQAPLYERPHLADAQFAERQVRNQEHQLEIARKTYELETRSESADAQQAYHPKTAQAITESRRLIEEIVDAAPEVRDKTRATVKEELGALGTKYQVRGGDVVTAQGIGTRLFNPYDKSEEDRKAAAAAIDNAKKEADTVGKGKNGIDDSSIIQQIRDFLSDIRGKLPSPATTQ